MSRAALASFLLLVSCAASSPDAASDGAAPADAAVRSEAPIACGSVGSPCCANDACAMGTVCVMGTCLSNVECLSDIDCNGDGGAHLLQCKNGSCVCVAMCGDAGGCVDVSNDAENCGSCGHVCPHNETCQAGKCGCTLTTCPRADAGADAGTGAESACVDLMTDNANCGACGAPCDYACSAGKCGPKVLALGKNGRLALDPSSQTLVMGAGLPTLGLYTCSAAGCGGNPTLDVPYGGNIGYLGASNGRFFFQDTQQATLFTCTEIGCSSLTSLATNNLFGLPGAFFVTSTSAFWADGQHIWTCPTNAACIPTQIAAGTQPGSVAVDGNDLYWGDNGAVYVADLDGKNATQIATDVNIYMALAAGGRVFWNGAKGFMTASRTVAATLFGGCSGGTTCFGTATDGTNIYFLGFPTSGPTPPAAEVAKCPIGPTCTTPVTVVPWSGAILGPNLVVDAKNVYWTENDDLVVFHK